MEISVTLDLMFNMKSKIVIFESNKLDGKMSKNPKFYNKEVSEKERYERFHKDRLNLGKKLGNYFGDTFEIIGGVILILLGVKILLEGLGILVL